MNQIARCDWLPERVRWSHLARSWLPAVSRKKNIPKSHIINPLLTKFVRSRWLDIGLVLFLRVYGLTETKSRSLNTQKEELGQYPAISTSHLVNNPYILTSCLVNNPKYVEPSPYRHLFNTDTISITEKRTFSSGGGGVHILVSSSFYITLQYIFYTCIPWQWSVSARACCVQSYWYSVLITE